MTSIDKLCIVASHLSILLGVGIFLPLIVFLVKKGDSEVVARNAKEALNFHISIYIYAIVAGLLCFVLIGIPLIFALGIAILVLPIIACVATVDGADYRYPFTLRLIP